MKSTTVHLRIPLALKHEIGKLALLQRRPWTQMTVLLLSDAVNGAAPKKVKPAGKKAVDSR